MIIEAMKQVLEAWQTSVYGSDRHHKAMLMAMTNMGQVIAEAEKQEPKCVVIVEVFGKDWRLEYMSLPVGRHKLYAQQYLYTRPQPKVEQEPVAYTTGHCKEKAKPGGCQLHNLHCSFPACDRKES